MVVPPVVAGWASASAGALLTSAAQVQPVAPGCDNLSSVIDWEALRDADCMVPAAPLSDLLAALEDLLTSSDPGVRDGLAYTILWTWLTRGVLDGEIAGLGDRMVAKLTHPEIQARTFAVLILAVVVGKAGATDVRRWRDGFASWYRTETDLRGWDDQLGWLHAVAHGADALGEFGRSQHMTREDLTDLLDLVVDRLLSPAGYRFAHREDDRLAQALYAVLTRPELTAACATGWLDRIEGAFRHCESGPVAAWASNTIHTLQALYVAVDRGARLDQRGEAVPVPQRKAVLDRIAAVLAVIWGDFLAGPAS